MLRKHMSDQAYLLEDQYKTSANLEARIDLHARYSTNERGWHPWVMVHDELANHSVIRITKESGLFMVQRADD